MYRPRTRTLVPRTLRKPALVVQSRLDIPKNFSSRNKLDDMYINKQVPVLVTVPHDAREKVYCNQSNPMVHLEHHAAPGHEPRTCEGLSDHVG